VFIVCTTEVGRRESFEQKIGLQNVVGGNSVDDTGRTWCTERERERGDRKRNAPNNKKKTKRKKERGKLLDLSTPLSNKDTNVFQVISVYINLLFFSWLHPGEWDGG